MKINWDKLELKIVIFCGISVFILNFFTEPTRFDVGAWTFIAVGFAFRNLYAKRSKNE